MRVSKASVTGAVFGFMLIAGAVALGTRNYGAFLSAEGFMIVVGGSLAVAFMSFEANYVIEALKSIGLMFRRPRASHETLHHELVKVIEWARIVKKGGLKGLEQTAGREPANDPF